MLRPTTTLWMQIEAQWNVHTLEVEDPSMKINHFLRTFQGNILQNLYDDTINMPNNNAEQQYRASNCIFFRWSVNMN